MVTSAHSHDLQSALARLARFRALGGTHMSPARDFCRGRWPVVYDVADAPLLRAVVARRM